MLEDYAYAAHESFDKYNARIKHYEPEEITVKSHDGRYALKVFDNGNSLRIDCVSTSGYVMDSYDEINNIHEAIERSKELCERYPVLHGAYGWDEED